MASINASPHKGIYGLLPKDIDSESGEFTLKLAKEKFGVKDKLLSEKDQDSFKKEFYSNKANKYFESAEETKAK